MEKEQETKTMQLSGQCKENFEQWFRPNLPLIDIGIFNDKTTPDSMKFGVYVDFFDSVGIEMELIKIYATAIGTKTGWATMFNRQILVKSKITRQEARTEAIIKADYLHNNR